MTSTLSTNERKFIKEIAKNNGFINFTIEETIGCEPGDNYFSNIIRVIVKENERKLNLITKSTVFEQENSTNFFALLIKFEVFAYEKMLPILLGQLHKDGEFCEYPKYYGFFEEPFRKSIILEDMKPKGYTLFDRHKLMTREHLTNIFKVFGKFHANSYALKFNNPEKFNEVRNQLAPPIMNTMFLEVNRVFESMLNAVKDDDTVYRYLKERKKYWDNYSKSYNNEEEHSVFIHGDNWCNNFLFKYEGVDDSTNITDVCFLDWQFVGVGNPIYDLSYFFYLNGSKDQFLDLEYFLQKYQESINKTLTDYGKVISLEEIKEQWKIHSFYGLIAATIALHVVLVDGKNAPKLNVETDPGSITNVMLSLDINRSEYNSKMKNIIKFMYDNEFL